MTSNRDRKTFSLLVCLVLFSLFALSLPAAPLEAELDSTVRSKIDTWLKTIYPADEPGATVLIARDGEALFRGGYGMANLELGIPLEPDMVFRIGSITKQFTAAAILMLEQQGKLKVSDPIEKYLTGYPTHGHKITIEHLLNHTSGIFSYTGIPDYMDNEIRRDLSTQELVDVFKNLPMDFAPGERMRYNNSGYVLLGAIIEAVSGKSYPDFVEEEIFNPLGMKDSHYGGDKLISKRVSGYAGRSGNYSNAPFLSMTQPQAAGSLLSSVDDLLRWNSALVLGDLISKSAYQRMTTKSRLNSGDTIDYGYGFSLGTIRGKPTVEHGGGIHGFSTYGLWVPETRVYVSVLTNIPGRQPSPGVVARKLAAYGMGDPFPEFEEVELPMTVLQRYQGVYEIEPGQTRTLVVRNGKLHSQRSGGPLQEVRPASETTFFYPNSLTYIEMVTDDNGQVVGMKAYQNGEPEAEDSRFVTAEIPKREAAQIDTSVYADYVGTFEVAPGFSAVVTREQDRLFVQLTGQPRIEIFPESETDFFLEIVEASITFVRGAGGRVDQIILHQGGQDVPAKRVQ